MIRKIYYVEDDKQVGYMMKLSLETINDVCPVKVSLFERYETFIDALREERPNLIILDLMLPNNVDGYQVLKMLKANKSYKDIPVIIVSAKLAEYYRVACLDAGACAYFTKPFLGLLELNSAVKNFLRVPKDMPIIICGGLIIDSSTRRVTVDGEEVILTTREFELLRYLAENRLDIIVKQNIIDDVWGGNLDPKSRTVDAHIKSIRQKVFPNDTNALITLPKFGYKFEYGKE